MGRKVSLGELGYSFPSGFPNKEIFLNIFAIHVLFLTFMVHVEGNPIPKTFPTLSSSPVVMVADQQQQQDRLLLAKPSQLTFKIGGRCDADVSLEYVICRNLRHRGDLPKKQSFFDKFEQGTFVNISRDPNGDILLEDFKSLFPNLVSLSITESRGSAVNLINLTKSGTPNQWTELREPLEAKSLIQVPHFEKRLQNLNNFNNGGTSGGSNRSGNGTRGLIPPKPKDVAKPGDRFKDKGYGRGERALDSEEEKTNTHSNISSNNNTNSVSSSAMTTTVIDYTAVPGSSTKGEHKSFPDQADYQNDISSVEESNDIFFPTPTKKLTTPDTGNDVNVQMDEGTGGLDTPEPSHKLRPLVWPSIRILNLSSNQLSSEALPDNLGSIFPNLTELNLSNNQLSTLERVRKGNLTRLMKIDISANPLDCNTLDWIEKANFTLVQPNETLCDQPPHQNKAKPIFKVLHLLKKVRDECLLNCSCDIAYIWEQNHVVHSKTVVNCSNKGFFDFPNPENLPRPTDTLDLRSNKITSMATFVSDERYLDLNVMNLYLDDNQISSIDILEGSDWFYQFQIFSIRHNDLTEVPVYVLDNVFRLNTRLLQIDLSNNNFRCDCFTVSSFKVWLLRYSNQIGHVEDVRCANTKEQIRYMKMEQWCQVDSGTPYMDVLDMVSIVLAILIVAVVSKVYYDYWNFKNKGKLPWLVGKM